MATVQGVGDVTNAQLLDYYRRSGYTISGEKDTDVSLEPTGPEVEPVAEPKPAKRAPRKRTAKP